MDSVTNLKIFKIAGIEPKEDEKTIKKKGIFNVAPVL